MQLPIKTGAVGALLAALWGTNLSMAFGQIQSSNPARESLEEQFVDPLTTLPQVFLKDEFSPVNYGTDVQTNQVVARIIIPRIPPNTLLPFVQLVRPSFSLVTVPGPKGGTRTDFGDTQLFDLAVLPWPPAETGLRFGLGPTFVFPTANAAERDAETGTREKEQHGYDPKVQYRTLIGPGKFFCECRLPTKCKQSERLDWKRVFALSNER